MILQYSKPKKILKSRYKILQVAKLIISEKKKPGQENCKFKIYE
jgi:hypothetical protein